MKKDNTKKYAKALFQLASETSQAEKIKDSFKSLKSLYERDIVKFFSNPFVGKADKIDLVKNSFPNLPLILENLISILIDERKLSLLSEIERKYNDEIYRSKNILVARVITADKLEKTTVGKIKDMLVKITNKEILIEEEIDKTIIGGLIVRAGDIMIDGSIKGKISSLTHDFLVNRT